MVDDQLIDDLAVYIKNLLLTLQDRLGLDVTNDRNFDMTPKRVARELLELMSGIVDFDHKLDDVFKSIWDEKYDETVTLRGIEAVGVCPHHLIPVQYKIDISYKPNGRVLGLSKLVRFVVLLSARPILQERLTEELVDQLMNKLHPQGCAVLVHAQHGCMTFRGIKQSQVRAETVAYRGCFESDSRLREAFLQGGD